MKTFLIQTVGGRVTHDFSFTLIEKVKFSNWFRDEKLYDYRFTQSLINTEGLINKGLENLIPVGSVEFVQDYYNFYHDIDKVLPINIPYELWKEKYLKRYVMLKSMSGEYLFPYGKYFIKDNDKIKGITDIVSSCDIPNSSNWIISELIDIESEWRGFVFNGELLDIRCYTGRFDVFPDVELVREMIKAYQHSPRAYTIDVGVNKDKGTFLIECHQFFSCGLYGFDNSLLPQMFSSCHREIVEGRFNARD